MTKTKSRLTGFLRVFTNIVIVVFVVLFVMYMLPLLKFMRNNLSGLPDEPNKADVVVNHDDRIVDLSLLTGDDETETPAEPTETPYEEGSPTVYPDPSETPETPYAEPTPTAVPSDVKNETPKNGSGSIPYVPDPIVEGVIKTPGCNIKLEPDARNVLVIGFDVKSELTDTMIVVSICERLHTVTTLSLSRDAYVPYQGAVQNYLVSQGYSKSRGIYKLNACYTIGRFIHYNGGKFGNSGIDFLCHIITEMMPDANMHIDDYVFIKPDGLEGFVDYFGGVDVYFSEDRWVLTGDGTTKLQFEKGWHHLNGKQAVSFVRQRARYNETGRISSSGDPYRKANQLRFVKDLMNQLITVENLTRINEIFDEASKFMYHSINSTSQLTSYIRMATDFADGKYTVTSYVVSGRSIDPMGDGVSYVNLMY